MKKATQDSAFLEAGYIREYIEKVLSNAGVREDVSCQVAKGLVQASLRGIDSHGIRLLPHYLKGAEGGRINPKPDYKFEKTSTSTGKLDESNARSSRRPAGEYIYALRRCLVAIVRTTSATSVTWVGSMVGKMGNEINRGQVAAAVGKSSGA